MKIKAYEKLINNRTGQLMAKDKANQDDVERKALFFLLASNDELWNLQDKIYNFKDHLIKPEILESGICTSSKNLIQVGFNLYNNFPVQSLIDCFSGLDNDNFELLIQAIRIRFNKNN